MDSQVRYIFAHLPCLADGDHPGLMSNPSSIIILFSKRDCYSLSIIMSQAEGKGDNAEERFIDPDEYFHWSCVYGI